VVVADLNADRGKAIAGEIGGVFAATDVSDEESVSAAVQGRRREPARRCGSW